MPRNNERLTPEQEMAQIDNLLLRLRRYKTDDALGERASVNRTLSQLRLEFRDHPEWIPSKGTVVYFGSLLYADPRKYDIDILMVSPKEIPFDRKFQLEENIATTLERTSFSDRRVKPDQPVFTSIESINRYAKMKHIFRRQTRALANIAEHEAAMILSGEPLLSYPYLQDRFPRFQSDIRNIVQQGSSRFRQGIVRHLNVTLASRLQRRVRH